MKPWNIIKQQDLFNIYMKKYKIDRYEVNPYICFYMQFKFLYNCGIL